MTAFKAAYDDAIATVTQDGSPYEIGTRSFGGVDYQAFLSAPPTLVELLAPARKFGDEEFLVYQDERLTFKAFFDKVDRLAYQLVHHFGIVKGDRIAIAMRNYPEWLVAYVAIVNTGAVVVPLNSWGLADELRQNLTDAGVSLLLCDQQRLGLIDPADLDMPSIVARPDNGSLPPGCVELAQLLADTGNAHIEHPPATPAIDSEDPAMIMYTSGTSGRAKGAVFNHRNCCQAIINLEAISAATYLTNMDTFNRHGQKGLPPRALLTVPLFHVSGLYSQFLLNLRNGRSIVMMYKWDPATACELIAKENVTVVVGAPSMLLDLVKCEAFDRIDADGILNMSGGGAATPPRLAELVREKLPGAMQGAGWGLTESGGAGTAFTGCFMVEKPGSSGFVNPVVELRFCDEDGQEVPPGTPGEIWLKSPTAIAGYLNAPEANRNEFKDGWFKSGDIGYLDEDGCMFICDRAKDLVIRGGENIYPVEIENCLLAMPGVERVAAFAVPSERLGEELAAVVKVSENDLPRLTAKTVQQYCKERLAGFKVPSFVKFTTGDFPVNATNKILKKKVRELFFPQKPEKK